MKRRTAIKSGILSLAGISALQFKSAARPSNFIAIGSLGGRILEPFYHANQPGTYTWIKDQYSHRCIVPDLQKVEIQHPYDYRYFAFQGKNPKLPEEELSFDLALTGHTHEFQTIVLVDPACYLSQAILQELISFLKERQQRYHVILRLPFVFESKLWQESTQKIISQLGKSESSFSIFSSDSIRSRGNLNLEVAFDLVYLQYVKEFEQKVAEWKSEKRI